MDKAQFGSDKTGELVKIQTNEDHDWAFIPDMMPEKWSLPTGLNDLLGDARELLGKLDGIGRTLVDPNLLLTPLQHREAIRSSSLEGTYATPEELLQYEINPKEPTSESDPRNAWKEVHNYGIALQHGYNRIVRDDFPICLRLIKETHQQLLQGVRGRDKSPGQFRNRQVHVGSGRRYIPPPVVELEPLLNNLEQFMHQGLNHYNPLVMAYMVHYQFEAIHPFLDGNGRIGRVLLALTTFQWHNHFRPWLYMSGFFDRYKSEYIEKLFNVSANGAWDDWIEFCLKGTVLQCKDSIRRCDELNALKHSYYEKYSCLFHRAHRLIGKLFEQPVFRINDVMEWCGITRPTAQKDVNKLIDCGIVNQIDVQKPKTYFAHHILDAAYREVD